MILKFGALVLLLVIDGASAEQRQPTFPSVDPIYPAQQVKNRRRGLLHTHSAPIRALSSSNSGRFLLSTERTCAWDSENEECSLSISTMMNLLEDSDIDFATIAIQHLECVEKTNKEDCNNEEVCLWDEVNDECLYLDLRRNYEDSPCARAAPVVFDIEEATMLCAKEDSSDSCETKRQCVWSSDFDVCLADEFLIVFGIENFQQKVAQVLDEGREAIFAEYRRQRRRNNFTWESILEYEPNSIECPSDVEPLVCDYADEMVPRTLGRRFYCSGRYESSLSDCFGDALCEWNSTSDQCDANDFWLPLEQIPSSPAFTDEMPDGVYRRSHEAAFACSNTSERRGCNGTCVWNPPETRCEASPDLVAIMLTELADNSDDALCTYINVVAQSECNAQSTRRQCRQTEFCHWDAEEECRPTAEFILSAAADRDPSLESRYTQVKRQCSGHNATEECLADYYDNSSDKISAWTMLLVCFLIQLILVVR